MLLVELGLIRWLGAQVLYLSYFSNFVLLGSFLGIGLGFLRSSRPTNIYRWAPIALVALFTFVMVFPVEVNRSQRDLIFFGGRPSGLPIWVVLPVIFMAVAAVMATIADGVGRAFATFEPLEAYRLDIGGSIAGIAMFSMLALLHAPPLAWAAIVVVLLYGTLDRDDRRTQLPRLAVFVIVLGVMSFGDGVSWSPYYKVRTFHPAELPDSLAINVNGIPHQAIQPATNRSDLYFQPYATGGKSNPSSVLIIGAGSGNDVSTALLAGAQSVDAVEIDPRIQEIGAQRHPDRPYSDPRVHVHIDDGRAFIERSDKKYDVIILGLPDSLTLVAGQSSLRLESYLFTKEAFESYRDHLAPGGVFTMYNIYRENWLRDRYAGTLVEVFGSRPCQADTVSGNAEVALTVGLDALNCGTVWTPEGDVAPPATDDHPFPYLRESKIPGLYLSTIALVLLGSALLVRTVGGIGIRGMRPFTDLFAMGVAFLLLGSKSVVQFALLFGTTWFVNALVFAGILIAVYIAIEVSKRTKPINRKVLYGALLASILVAWLVPLSALLSLDLPARFAVATALTFAPVFIANLIFAQRFAEVASSTAAFGANLLGAMVGGLVEYIALITGYRNVLLLVGFLYFVAALLERSARSSGLGPATVSALPA